MKSREQNEATEPCRPFMRPTAPAPVTSWSRGGRHDGAGIAELRDGLLNQRSTLCGVALLRLRDQIPRLRERRHGTREDPSLVEHVDSVLRVVERGLQTRVLLT